MPNNFVLTAEADVDLQNIFTNVVDFTQSFESGTRLIEDFYKKFNLIAFMPNAVGRLRDDERREAFCRGYRIVYRVENNYVLILSVIHCSRIYPRP